MSSTEYQPATEEEQSQALRAVYETRRIKQGDDLVESLTDRERLLIERAWTAGAQAARNDLARKLINPHAVTLDAQAVAQTVQGWSNDPIVFNPPGWVRIPGEHYDQRIVGLIRGTDKQLEREGRGGSQTQTPQP